LLPTSSIPFNPGEAKQLGFAMYNIAFTGIIIVTILRVADMDQLGKVILQAIGALWGTLFSAFAFVLPRLLESKQQHRIMDSLSTGVTFEPVDLRKSNETDRTTAVNFETSIVNYQDRIGEIPVRVPMQN
jgi:hypothetical protein